MLLWLETERLMLLALDQELLQLMVEDISLVESRLALAETADMTEPHPGFYQRILETVSADPEEYPWLTDWQVVLKSENRIIGGITFKRAPKTDGFVEFGYGLAESYWGRGYMTEAIRAATMWALADPRLKVIIARTTRENVRSMRVLEKVGFTPYDGDAEHFLWRLNARG